MLPKDAKTRDSPEGDKQKPVSGQFYLSLYSSHELMIAQPTNDDIIAELKRKASRIQKDEKVLYCVRLLFITLTISATGVRHH